MPTKVAAGRLGSLGPPSMRPASFLRLSPALEAPVLGFAGVIAFLVVWQAFAASGAVSPLLLASPLRTADAFVALFADGAIWPHLASSVRLLGIGFLLAAVLGTTFGILAGWFTGLRATMAPHVALLYATPSVALMPLLIVWFGLGLASQLAVVVLLAFFPCFYAGLDAVRMTDRNLIRVARSFGATQGHIFRTIILPGSVPHVLSGFRISLGKAIVAMTVVELYAASAGLGYLLIIYGNAFKTAEVFSVILVIALLGLSTRFVLRRIELRFDAWRGS